MQRSRLLFVDDEPRILDGIRRMLRADGLRWEAYFAESVDEALRIASSVQLDAVVSDVSMPGKTGLDLVAEFKSRDHLRHIPVIMLTGSGDLAMKRKALNAGAVDLLTKPVDVADLRARLESVLKIKWYEDRLRDYACQLEQRVAERTRDLEASRIDIVLRLAMAGEFRDTDTGHHVLRVAQLSGIIAEHLGLSKMQCEQIRFASPLHDIGKVGIPDSILRKAGPLTEGERLQMQEHCAIGHAILTNRSHVSLTQERCAGARSGENNELLDIAARIALHHHERWDGTGYPHRLSREQIPIEARIVGAADMYDALCSRRPYKEPIHVGLVQTLILEESGRHIDPQVCEAMKAAWPALHEIMSLYADAVSRAMRMAA